MKFASVELHAWAAFSNEGKLRRACVVIKCLMNEGSWAFKEIAWKTSVYRTVCVE